MEYIFSDGYGEFPRPEMADENGLLAVGASLAADRLVAAYDNGIFPWYNEEDPVCWYSPAERFVLLPSEINISKSMKAFIGKPSIHITFDRDFSSVIQHCAAIKRKGQNGTWIHSEMIEAYITLHQLGIAHSIEVWETGQLVGGLYGMAVDRVFCGESMFSLRANTSKAALISLCQSGKYDLVDCQMRTDHLASMGGKFISRAAFLAILNKQQKNFRKIFGY